MVMLKKWKLQHCEMPKIKEMIFGQIAVRRVGILF